MPGSQSASPLNYSVVTQAVKVHYKPMRVRDLVYKKNPLLALMSKYERFGGLNMPISDTTILSAEVLRLAPRREIRQHLG